MADNYHLYIRRMIMKNKKGIILSISSILIGIAIIIINIILKKFDWHLRSWLMILASYMISLGIIALGVLSLKTMQSKTLKILFITLWILLSMVILFIEFIIL